MENKNGKMHLKLEKHRTIIKRGINRIERFFEIFYMAIIFRAFEVRLTISKVE